MAGSGQETWLLPVQHLSHSLESLWQKTGRGRSWALRREGTAAPRGTQCQQPALSSLGTAQGSAWQPWKASLGFLSRGDRQRMNPTCDHLQGIPEQNQHLLPAAAVGFHVTTPKVQRRSMSDSSGSEHLPNHPILWPPGAPCTPKAAQSHPFCPKLKDTCFEATSEV